MEPASTPTATAPTSEADTIRELSRCSADPWYFIHHYCHVDSATTPTGGGRWIPFHLWPAQIEMLDTIQTSTLIVALKARQLGFTWLIIAYVLWLMLFRRAATVLLFSKRDDEATDLLEYRLKGMYRRLPVWMQAGKGRMDSMHQWQLSNGSRAMAFPTTAGHSYSASFVLIDEADKGPDLRKLLSAVKPTVDAGGQMVLLSSPDKDKPESIFKTIYRDARAGKNDYTPVFYPWSARPERDDEWYSRQVKNYPIDELRQEYPATEAEALAPRSIDKRLDSAWLEQCYQEGKPLTAPHVLGKDCPAITGLVIYATPRVDRSYVIGADPAENNPNSDDSAFVVLEKESGEQVASYAAITEPTVFAGYLDRVGTWYNHAPLLVEANNHGGTVLAWLRDHSKLQRLCDLNGKPGWTTTSKSKSYAYDKAAEVFRNQETVIHSFSDLVQLQSIEGSTLRAPEAQHDDRAIGYVLAIVAMIKGARASQTAPPQSGGGGVGMQAQGRAAQAYYGRR